MSSESVSILGGLLTIFIIVVVAIVVMLIPYWKIYQRTGQSGAMALLLLIPLINIIMLFILAFGEWPIERELNELRRMKNPPAKM